MSKPRKRYKGTPSSHRGLKKGTPRKCCSTLAGQPHLPMCGNYNTEETRRYFNKKESN